MTHNGRAAPCRKYTRLKESVRLVSVNACHRMKGMNTGIPINRHGYNIGRQKVVLLGGLSSPGTYIESRVKLNFAIQQKSSYVSKYRADVSKYPSPTQSELR